VAIHKEKVGEGVTGGANPVRNSSVALNLAGIIGKI
jgi:hypothetical protein